MKIRRKIQAHNIGGRIYYSVGIPREWVHTIGTRDVVLDIGRRDIIIKPIGEEGER